MQQLDKIAIDQAQKFQEVTNLTGIILTKLDGTSKGGIILSIKDLVNVSVKFIGLGEGLEDLRQFNLDEYIYSLTEDFKRNKFRRRRWRIIVTKN